MNENYDFYGMGARYARDAYLNLKKLANEIGKKYGEDAKMNFEAGVVSEISSYSSLNLNSEILDRDIENATLNFSIDNTRNNSFFGGCGASLQYKRMPNGELKYNDNTIYDENLENHKVYIKGKTV